MRFLKRYAMWVAAPLALTMGCAGGPSLIPSASKARDVDQSQRMLQIAQRYEAEGKTEAAERLYRQLAHMQPRNAEVRQRLEALAAKSKSTASPSESTAAAQNDAQQLMAKLRENRAAYLAEREREKSGTVAPTTTPSVPTLAARPQPQAAPTPFNPFPAEESVAGEWEHAIAKAPAPQPQAAAIAAAASPFAEFERHSEAEIVKAPEVSEPLPSIQPSARTSREVVAAPPVAASPLAEERVEPAPAAEQVAVAQTAPAAVPAQDEEAGWWDGVFADAETVEAEPAQLAAAEPQAVETIETAPSVAQQLDELAPVRAVSGNWGPTATERSAGGMSAEVARLTVQLSSADPSVRIAALHGLASLGEAAASAELAIREHLDDSNPIVRAHAAMALREVKNDAWDSIRTLRLMIFHPQDEVAQMACYMLGRIGAEAMESVTDLQTLRDAERGLTSLHAAEALLRIAPHDRVTVEHLVAVVERGSNQERWFATVALAAVGEPLKDSVIDALTSALSDTSAEVRAAAALSLGGLGESAERALPALEQVAFNDVPEVQDAATTALACIRL